MGADDDRPPPSLDDLQARLEKAKGETRRRDGGDASAPGASTSSAMGMGMRIGVEMVVAVAVGTGIGYALDTWLGTKPWLLIVFFFLGSGAGIMNVYRAATNEGLAMGYKRRPEQGTEQEKRSDPGRGDRK